MIELDKKYSEDIFLEFWHRYNLMYNQINGTKEIIDDVEIYFDNRIGIVAPKEYKEKESKTKNPTPTDSDKPNKFKYNILKVIEKRNQEEEEIDALIKDFEEKITLFFEYIKSDADGKRLIAKMTSISSSFSHEEILKDFSKLYRKFTIKNKDLGEFFKRETKDILSQLCDDFEKYLIKPYPEQQTAIHIAAED